MLQKTPLNRVLLPSCLRTVLGGVVFAFLLILGLVAAINRPTPVSAATNNTINFQARLQTATGAIVPDGYYNVQFKLYDASTGGTNLWTESYIDANGVTAGQDNRVRVQNGYLSVPLGSQTTFPTTINWDQQLYLTMNIGGVTQTATPTYDGEMTPRLALTAVPYAFKAGQLAKQTGSFQSTLDFATQTGSRSLLLPDESGTLCIRNSTACGFASASGSGNYIQNTTSPQTANFNVTGDGTIGGDLSVGGTIQQNNTYPVYRWMTAGATDTAWKTIANVAAPTGLYVGASFQIDVMDANGNFGNSANGAGFKYYASIVRSAGAQDDTVSASVSGPTADYVRVVKTSNSAYELQVRQPAIYEYVTYTAQVTSNNSATVSYMPAPANGSTGGTIYTATVGHTDYAANLNAAGTLTVQGTAAGTVKIGTSGASDQILAVGGGAYFDALGQNNGDLDKALRFGGSGSPVGIGSKQTAGGNQYGLDFYTGYTSRLSIASGGNIGIGIGPSYKLDVGGDINTTGSYRVGGTAGATTTCSGGQLLQNIVVAGGIVTGGSCVAAGAGGVTSVGALDSQTKSANGAVIASNTLYLQTADASNAGLVSTGIQTFAGAKTFTGNVNIQTATNSASAFQVQNSAGAPVFLVDTTSNNYVANPGFETDVTTGWTSLLGTETRTRHTTLVNTYHGIASQSIATPATANAGARVSGFTATPTFATSTTWTFSVYAKASATMTSVFQMGYNLGAGDTTCLTGQTVGTAGFSRYSCVITLTSGQSISSLFVRQSDAVARTIYIDAVQLNAGSTLLPYQIGNIQLRGVVSTPATFQAASNSTTAFQVQNSAGNGNNLVVDTLNNIVYLNSTVRVANGSYGAALNVAGNIISRGNSTSALQVQNSAAVPIFSVDTATNPSGNRVTNYGFELDTANWANITGGTLTRQTTLTNAYGGIASGQIATTATAGAGARTTGFTATLAAGTYTMSFYAKSSAAMTTLAAGYNQVAGSPTANDVPCTLDSTTVGTAGFGRYTCTFTTTANLVSVWIEQTDAVARTIYIDGVQLVPGTASVAYSVNGTLQLRGAINAPLTFQNASNSTTAFQIQNSAGTSNLFVADTLNNRINIGGALAVSGGINNNNGGITNAGAISGATTITASGVVTGATVNATTGLQTGGNTRIDAAGNITGATVNVAGSIVGGVFFGVIGDFIGVKTSNTGASDAGKWTKLATCTLGSQYQDCHSTMLLTMNGDGSGTTVRAQINWRVKQQATFGSNPAVQVEVNNVNSLTAGNFTSVITSNAGPTTVELWGQIPGSYQGWSINPLINAGSVRVAWLSNQGMNAAVSAGTQTAAVYSDAQYNSVNSVTGYRFNGATGSTTTCSGGQFLQNAVVQGGIITGGTCAAGGAGGVTTVGTIDSQAKNANGGVISGTSIYFQTADGSNPGLVSTSTQTFAGAKTFSGALTASSGVTVTGGASVSGGLNNNNGGITNVGAIAGATTINGAGNVTVQAAGTNTLTLDTVGAGAIVVGTNAATLTLGGGTNNTTLNLGTTTGNATVNIATGSTGTDVVNIGNSTTNNTTTNIYGNAIVRTPGTNSANAFQVQNSSGNSVLNVDTANNRIGINAANPLVALDIFGAATDTSIRLSNTTNTSGLIIQTSASTGNAFINNQAASNFLALGTASNNNLVIGPSGSTLLQNSANSTTAFQVQNAAGSTAIAVDTSNARILVGGGSTSYFPKLYFGDPGATLNNAWIGEFGGTDSDRLQLQGRTGVNLTVGNTATTVFKVDSTGNALFQNAANNLAAFQIQSTAGNVVLNADTINGRVQVSNLDALPGTGGSAITRTSRVNSNTSGTSGYGTGNYVAGNAFTPTAGSVLVATVAATENCSAGTFNSTASQLTISGGGLTWVAIGGAGRAVADTSCDTGIRSFYAVVGTPTSTSITVGGSGLTIYNYNVKVDEFTNVDTATPITGAAFGGRTVSDNSTFTSSLSASPSANDVKMGVSNIGGQDPGSYGNSGFNTPSGWTTIGVQTPFYGSSSQQNIQTGSASNSLTSSIGDLSPATADQAYGGFIIKQGAGSGGTLTLGGTTASDIIAKPSSTFQVQDVSGTSALSVDTINNVVQVNNTLQVGNNAQISNTLQVGDAFTASNLGPVLNSDMSDDFNSTTLNTGQWVYQGGTGGSYSLTANANHLRLSVTAGSRDCFSTTNACSYMYQNMSPAGNQQFITKIDTGTFQGRTYSGMMFRANTSNFIRFNIINDTTASCAFRLNVDVTRAGANTGGNVATSACFASAPATTYLKVDKVGSVYTYFYSTNGVNYTPITGNSYTSSFLLAWLNPTQVGMHLGAYGSTVTQNTDFDYFYTNTINPSATVGSNGLQIVGGTQNALNITNASTGGTLLNVDAINSILSINMKTCIGYSSVTQIEGCNATLGIYGTAQATGGFSTNANPDISEKIAVAPDVEAGDVVMADPAAKERAIKTGDATSSAIGVISDGTSGFMINRSQYDDESSVNDADTKPLVLAGRVPVKVTNENGSIKPGDSLMPSSTPGYAMKAKGSGETIGKALASFDGTSGKVLALINLSYANDKSATASGDDLTEQVSNLQGQVDAMGTSINTSRLMAASLTITGNAAIGGNLTVGGILSVGELRLSGHLVTSGDKPKLELQPMAGDKATVELDGNDTAGTVTIKLSDDFDVTKPGDLIKVLFDKQFTKAPQVIISPKGRDSATLNLYTNDVTKTFFTVNVGNELQKDKTYVFTYYAIQ